MIYIYIYIYIYIKSNRYADFYDHLFRSKKSKKCCETSIKTLIKFFLQTNGEKRSVGLKNPFFYVSYKCKFLVLKKKNI